MSFELAPKGWTPYDDQLLPINQNQALFSLLGTTFGGDGRVNFALPDLRGRTPVHAGATTRGRELRQHGRNRQRLADSRPHQHSAVAGLRKGRTIMAEASNPQGAA
jgi:microcystin-dependent protein